MKKIQTSFFAACFTACLLLGIAQAQPPIVAGVDHIGINVPDIPTGLAFFRDIMGFTPVTELGSMAMNQDWKQRFHIHQTASLMNIVALRAGNGSNIELFAYKSSQRSKEQPFGDDAGWTHIAFYVDDIKSCITYLRSKGIRFLSEPITIPSGPTAGETWAYFLAPWGAQMELVSYPHGKAYEKNAPMRLWAPGTISNSMKTDTLISAISATQLQSLAATHLSIWSERDQIKRQEWIKEVYATDLQIIDPFFLLNGYEGLNVLIDDLQQKFPDYHFSVVKPAEGHHNVGRLFWQFGPAANPSAITGEDVFVLENGKIKMLYVFIDNDKK